MVHVLRLRAVAGTVIDVPVMPGLWSSTTDTNAGNGQTVISGRRKAVSILAFVAIESVKRSDGKFLSELLLAGRNAAENR
jgi:hypothetical protein